MKFIKGKTIEDKINFIDKVLVRFQRRLHKAIVVLIYSPPIMGFVETPSDGGILGRYIIPCRGSINNGCILVDEFLDNIKEVSFMVSVEHASGHAQSFAIAMKKNKIYSFPSSTQVEQGDKLILAISSPNSIRGVWFSFTFLAAKESMHRESIAIDTLEEMVEKASK